jgi:hypothetical protein
MKNKLLFAGIALATLLFTSCSKLPTAEIDSANTAIEEARLSGADLYYPEMFVVLQDSMTSVVQGIDAQESKMLKNYSTSKEGLASIVIFANDVNQKTTVRKEEVKNEISVILSEIKVLTDSSKQLVLSAPKGKEGTAALQAINSEIAGIEASVVEASSIFEQGNYLLTLENLTASKEKAPSINNE